MDSYIYYVLVLKDLFQNLFGAHYPIEIITSIVLILYKPVQIVTGYDYTILNHNKIYVWGNNFYRELGLGDNLNRNSPHEISLHRIKSVSCGEEHTIVLADSDKMYVWGRNFYGQLGLSDNHDRPSPQELRTSYFFPRGTLQFESVVCGRWHTFALTLTSKTYVWGCNDKGQLGLGDCVSINKPQEHPLDHIESISCGEHHTIALTYDGTLYVWGDNKVGQLGLGDNINRRFPIKLYLSNIKSINCGRNYTMALTSEGKLYSWGHNVWGQLGLGDTGFRNVPSLVTFPGPLVNIRSVNCGCTHVVAMTSDSDLFYVWGLNTWGQLGLGHSNDQSKPQKLILKNINTVVCGEQHTLAISNINDVYAWGLNSYGQLGLGDNTNRNVPCKLNFKFE